VGPGSKGATPMFRLEQIDRLRLVVAVPEALAGGIWLGTRVQFTVSTCPAERFTGIVARPPARSIDSKTRTMPVELDVTNTDGLTPGMYADVAWSQGRGGKRLLIPQKSIRATTERNCAHHGLRGRPHFGLAVGKRFPFSEVAPYILAQVAGGIAGAGVLYVIASGKAGFVLSGGFAANGYGAHSPGGYSLTR